MVKRGQTPDFDEAILNTFEQFVARAEAAGKDHATAIELGSQALNTALSDQGRTVAASLERRGPRMLREHRRIARSFKKRLVKRWGRAFDLYYMVLVSATEAGEEFARKHEAAAREQGDLVYEAVVGLHARACRVATEVYELLMAGFPHGARARCRTLHELAVTAFVMTEHGRKPEHADLAERFFLHDAVMRYKEAVRYQSVCERLGMAPFSDDEMAAWRAEYDRLIQLYGRSFKESYGWASSLTPGANFAKFEELVDMTHLRSHYAWASNEVHSGIRGWTQNHLEWRGQVIRLAGRTNNELAEPGQMAIASLCQITAALLAHGAIDAPAPIDVLSMNAINELLDRCCEAFVEVQAILDADEERIQEELAREEAQGSSVALRLGRIFSRIGFKTGMNSD